MTVEGVWLVNEIPRRFWRGYALVSFTGAGGIIAVGLVLWLLLGNAEALFVFGGVGALLGGMFVFLNYEIRGMWPSHLGLTPEGIACYFPRRPVRSISWNEIRDVAVMPGTALADEWLRIWYRNRGEEGQLYVIGQTAHAVAREFRVRTMVGGRGH